MPALKRRRILKEPDGFTGSTSRASKVHVPFLAFGDKSAPASVPKPEKVISRPRYNLSFVATEQAQTTPVSKSKPLSKPVSIANLKRLEVPTAVLKSASDFRPLKPPIFIVESQSNTSTTPSLQRLPPPPPPPLQPPETPWKPHQNLTSHGPPPLPSKPVATPTKSMRTISTTHIARTNDLSTESGKAELASIFLHDQHPEILDHAEDNEDGNLNLGFSPQKMGRSSKGKGKEPKLVRYDISFSLLTISISYMARNGLAARASMLFSQTHTALALWQKEIENVLSVSSRPLTPDLRLRVIKIIDVPVGSGSRRSGTLKTSWGLSICRVLSAASHHKNTFHLLSGKKEDRNHLVVLCFPTTALPRTNTLHVRNPEDFAEGREVYVWEPWQEVSLPSSSPAADAEPLKVTAAPFPLLPSSLPLSPSPTRVKDEDISDLPITHTVLLCSRFLIMR